jgi:hypothetical protein
MRLREEFVAYLDRSRDTSYKQEVASFREQFQGDIVPSLLHLI